MALTRSAPASRRLVGAASGQLDRAGGVDDRRRHLQRLAGDRSIAALELLAGMPGPPGRGPRRDARARRRAARRGPRAGRRGGGRDGRPARGGRRRAQGRAIAAGRRDAGLCAGGGSRRSRTGTAALDALDGAARAWRRGARQGVARHRAGPARRRAARRARRARAAPDDRRADPGPAAGVRARRDPDAAVHPAAADDRLRQADPRGGPGQPHGQAGHADDGRGADHRRRRRCSPAPRAGRREGGIYRPARRRSPASACSAPSTTTSTRKTGEGIRVRQKLLWQVVVRGRRRLPDPADVRDHRDPVPFVGDVVVDPAVYVVFAAFAIVAAQQRRQHHRRPRRPRRRDADLRVRRVPDHRAAQRAGPAEPGVPVRADHRGAARASCGSTSTRPRSSWAIRGRCRSARRWR